MRIVLRLELVGGAVGADGRDGDRETRCGERVGGEGVMVKLVNLGCSTARLDTKRDGGACWELEMLQYQ